MICFPVLHRQFHGCTGWICWFRQVPLGQGLVDDSCFFHLLVERTGIFSKEESFSKGIFSEEQEFFSLVPSVQFSCAAPWNTPRGVCGTNVSNPLSSCSQPACEWALQRSSCCDLGWSPCATGHCTLIQGGLSAQVGLGRGKGEAILGSNQRVA